MGGLNMHSTIWRRKMSDGFFRAWPVLVAVAALIWHGSSLSASVDINSVATQANAEAVKENQTTIRENERAISRLENKLAERLATLEANQITIIEALKERSRETN